MNYKKIFLWPDPELPKIGDLFSNITEEDVESQIEEMWPNSNPVLFSSARSGLHAILQANKLTRGEFVWLPKYSSHCLYETIGRVSAPTHTISGRPKLALVYHQWGYPIESNFEAEVQIIEDCADTLFPPGSKSFFINNSKYMIQSLPKILGTVAGGIVFCKNSIDRGALREIRAQSMFRILNGALRTISKFNRHTYLYWHGTESLCGKLPSYLMSQISRKMRNIHEVIENVQERIDVFSPAFLKDFVTAGRFPSNLPIEIISQKEMVCWQEGGIFSSGFRRFNISQTAPNEAWKLVAPLPVHTAILDKTIISKLRSLELLGSVI